MDFNVFQWLNKKLSIILSIENKELQKKEKTFHWQTISCCCRFLLFDKFPIDIQKYKGKGKKMFPEFISEKELVNDF